MTFAKKRRRREEKILEMLQTNKQTTTFPLASVEITALSIILNKGRLLPPPSVPLPFSAGEDRAGSTWVELGGEGEGGGGGEG